MLKLPVKTGENEAAAEGQRYVGDDFSSQGAGDRSDGHGEYLMEITGVREVVRTGMWVL